MIGNNDHLRVLSQRNRAQVSLAIRKYGPISRVELSKMTGLSVACVCRIVEELLGGEILVEAGTTNGARGGPRTLLEVNPNGDPVAGILIGPGHISLVMGDQRANVLLRETIPYGAGEDPAVVIHKLPGAIHAAAEATGKDPQTFKGVGVSVAGLVDPHLGIINSITNRKGWEGFPIVQALSAILSIPVYADNDVRAGALSAHWMSPEAGGGTLYVLVSDGIGAAYVRNTSLFRGVHDAACLMGHMTMNPRGPKCECGKHGCLAAVATDVSFIRLVWPNATFKTATERVQMVKDGVEMALRGDETAKCALSYVTGMLGVAIANSISLLDPKRIFIGGTIISAAPVMVIESIQEEIVKNVWREAESVEISAIHDYEHFLMRGALGLVIGQPFRALQDMGNIGWN